MDESEVLRAVLSRARSRDWAGSDPYDSLLSWLGRFVIPLGPVARFAASQAALRIPLFRSAVRPARSVNPKGLALFLGAVVRGRAVLGDSEAIPLAQDLVTRIERCGVAAGDGIGWGYPFPWQSRSFWAPAGTPNAVVTATVGWQLLDCGDAFGDERARSLGLAAARALASHFHTTSVGEHGAALSYTANDTTRVVNISALAAKLLLRAGAGTNTPLADLARRLIAFTLDAQRGDGSWPYSLDRGGGWEDSFHTGYILEALLSARDAGIDVPDDVLTSGFAAYEGFFGADGSARLRRSPRSPYDAHSAAQGILTYSALRASRTVPPTLRREALGTSRRISEWALRSLWIPERGFFAYRGRGGRLDGREFTRWVQAWMALAMATMAARSSVRQDLAQSMSAAAQMPARSLPEQIEGRRGHSS